MFTSLQIKPKSGRPVWWERALIPLRDLDYAQIAAMLGLLVFGVLFIYGTGQQVDTQLSRGFWHKQLLWIAIGGGAWGIMAFAKPNALRHLGWALYAFSIVLLVAVLLVGVERYGARRWLQIAGFRFQASELAKVSTLLALSSMMSARWFNAGKISHIALAGLLAAFPFALIYLEPDLGSAMIIPPMVAAVLFVAGLKWRHVVICLIIVAVAVPAAYPFLKGYQKERILAFLDPDRDPLDKGYNSLQAELAVGSGGMYGKGFMNGTQNTLGFLPQTVSNTDFIFSVIAEETGFVGASALVGLYILLVGSIIRVALIAPDGFGRSFAIGAAVIFFAHSYINIAMSIRLMPITGLPLPLVSYGGSFVVISMFCLGIVQAIHRQAATAAREK